MIAARLVTERRRVVEDVSGRRLRRRRDGAAAEGEQRSRRLLQKSAAVYFFAASVFGGSVQIFFGAGPGSALTLWFSVPMPSMLATILSPGFSQICSGRTLRDMPVPAGLPDEITSPGNIVRIDVLYSTSS
jgi:hypothetical protein